MPLRVGIPRALLWFKYGPGWQVFFRELGADVVVSPPTSKALLDRAVLLAVDEACLPAKLVYGHVDWLKGRCDLIFLPRMVSEKPWTKMCPKHMGVPDMVRAGVDGLPPLISPTIDLSRDKRKALLRAALEAARPITRNGRAVRRALKAALEAHRRYRALLRKGLDAFSAARAVLRGEEPEPPVQTGDVSVAVIGHEYNVHDKFVNLELVDHLRGLGARVLTAEAVPEEVSEAVSDASLRKPLYWSYEKHIMGAAYHLARRGEVDGVVILTAFGCGPDSLVTEIMVRDLTEMGVPVLLLTFDEHSGEAGILTRVEAFFDLLVRRKGAVVG